MLVADSVKFTGSVSLQQQSMLVLVVGVCPRQHIKNNTAVALVMQR